MPARTGRQYLNGLREQDREVWLAGERVKDVTTHPGLKNGARAIASLYDMQTDPKLRDEMTYVSPTHGGPRRALLHHSADPRGPRKAPRHDAQLGAHDLRHDGPLARLHERHLRRLGGCCRLFCRRDARAARIRREHAELLRIHPRERPDPDPLADQPAAQPHRLRRLQPAGRDGARRSSARPMPASSCAARASWRPWGRSPTRSASIRRAWRAMPRRTARSRSALRSRAARRVSGSCAARVSTSAARISTIRSARALRRWIASSSSTT